MKRTLALILCAALALGLCACAAVAAQETLTEDLADPVKETAGNIPAMEAETSRPAAPEESSADLFKSVFLPMAKSEIGATLDDFTAAMVKHKYLWREENGVYYAEDIQNPGNYMALICAGDNISQMIYHCTLDGTERTARVSFAEENPKYFIKATAFHDGTEVLSHKELQKYITNQDLFSEETPQGISNGKMIDILSDNGVFYNLDLYREGGSISSTIEEYCAMFSAETGIPAAITKVAATDLDGDGVKEVLLWITVNDSTDYGTLVLHDYGKNVVGHLFSYRQLFNVKADGSFWRSDSSSNNGAARLAFDVGGWSYVDVSSADYDAQEDLRWLTYPREDYSELFQ